MLAITDLLAIRETVWKALRAYYEHRTAPNGDSQVYHEESARRHGLLMDAMAAWYVARAEFAAELRRDKPGD